MAYPKFRDIFFPILKELDSVGGGENVRFLYERLIPYFPQLNDEEIVKIKNGTDRKWRKLVQEAAKNLDEDSLITREQGFWEITKKGKAEVSDSSEDFQPTAQPENTLTHIGVQKMLVEIGEFLNFHAQTEFEYYDVIWRKSPNNSRISHVFEVQSKGNLDSALTKLKRAYEAQRSKPYLILSSERDLIRAKREINPQNSGAFQELMNVLMILSFSDVQRVYQSISQTGEILKSFLKD